MEFLLYLVLIALSLIYLKLTINYHPRFINFFKATEAPNLSINKVHIHMLIDKINKTEKIKYEKKQFEKTISIDSKLTWLPMGSDEVVNENLNIEAIRKAFFERENINYGYKFNFFGKTSVILHHTEQEIQWNEKVPKQCIGTGNLMDYIFLSVYCSKECFDMIKNLDIENSLMSITFECDIKTEKDEIIFFVNSFEVSEEFEIHSTYQYKWWWHNEIKGDERKRLEKKYSAYFNNLEKARCEEESGQ